MFPDLFSHPPTFALCQELTLRQDSILWRHDSLAIFEGAPPKSSKFIRRPTLQYRGSCYPPLPIPFSHRASKLSRQPHEPAVKGRVYIHKKSSEVVEQIRGRAVSHSSTLQRCSRRRVCNPHNPRSRTARCNISYTAGFCLRVIRNRFHHGHKNPSRKLYGRTTCGGMQGKGKIFPKLSVYSS
jgi:hypothetical protein